MARAMPGSNSSELIRSNGGVPPWIPVHGSSRGSVIAATLLRKRAVELLGLPVARRATVGEHDASVLRRHRWWRFGREDEAVVARLRGHQIVRRGSDRANKAMVA